MLELLAPAGSMEALYAAVQNGANAVYLGSGIFNARQGAKNFTTQTLTEAVKYCHIRGVAVHLTLNTLATDRELAKVAEIAERVNANVRSMGVALAPCTVPHAGEPSFTLAEDEIEMGVGIHGEPGRHRVAMTTADSITDQLMEPVLSDLGVASGDRVLLFVNGMGGTPLSELYIVYRRAARILEERGARVERSLVGNYITALEMEGASVTVLRLDDELTDLWDSPVNTPALRWGV